MVRDTPWDQFSEIFKRKVINPPQNWKIPTKTAFFDLFQIKTNREINFPNVVTTINQNKLIQVLPFYPRGLQVSRPSANASHHKYTGTMGTKNKIKLHTPETKSVHELYNQTSLIWIYKQIFTFFFLCTRSKSLDLHQHDAQLQVEIERSQVVCTLIA